jgi:hypothetical protein
MSDAPVVVFDPAKDAKFNPAKRSLDRNEEVIRMGLGTFVEVGQALMDIRDGGQYREAGFDTFDEYCKVRWGFGKSWASEHIAGSKVVEAIGVRDREQLPANLTQTKPLVPVLNSHGEEAVRNAWNQIVESHTGDGAITGREIRAFLNPTAGVPPSQRPVSDAYLSALDKLAAALKTINWAAEKGQGHKVPKPVAERYAQYVDQVEALGAVVKSISRCETPGPDSFGTK